MSNPIPGWYPDPEGNTSKIRYWDGQQWTDKFMDWPIPRTPVQDGASSASQHQEGSAPATQQAPSPVGATAPPENMAASSATTGTQANPYTVHVNIVEPVQRTYPQTEADRTLRLVAFIFAIVCTVIASVAIIPLCWMIPMTVHCWGIYKGTKPNTVAFGVCSLLFLSVVSGILLLVSNLDD